MLVLTQSEKQRILIGDKGEEGVQVGEYIIRFTVLSIQGDKVKIGIEAPDDIGILRESLVREKEQVQ